MRVIGCIVSLSIEVAGKDVQEKETEDLVSFLHTQDMDEDTEVVVTGISLGQTVVIVMKFSLTQNENLN